jgi:putative ABC transport system permease protein
MSLLTKLKALLPGRRRTLDQDMRDELESIAGFAEEEGDRRRLGNMTLAGEKARSVWTMVWLEQTMADLRFALRLMRKNPLFTVTAVLSLALGIGANTAIFSLIHGILLKPLPVQDPESLVILTSHSPNEMIGDFGYLDYLALHQLQDRAFAGILASSRLNPAVTGSDGETVQRKVVSGNYFSLLGVRPLLGRVFQQGEDDLPLALVSESWWRRAMGGEPTAIGKTLDLDGRTFEIVGVIPAAFRSETPGESADVWITLAGMPADMRKSAGFTWLNLMGRLAPGTGIQQAQAAISSRIEGMQNRFITRIDVEPGRLGSAGLRNTFSGPLTLLMGIAAVALLMSCTNLAGILLARSSSRQREIATRLAIGASRARLFRQLLTESILLAMFGGLLGLGFAIWGQTALLRLASGAGRNVTLDLSPDPSVLAFTAFVSLLTGILFGLGPAVKALRDTISWRPPTHKQNRFLGVRGGLIALQIALSLLLLVAGGLFVRTLRNLQSQDIGVRTGNLLSVRIDARRGEGQPEWTRVLPELMRRTESLPGVVSVAGSMFATLANAGGVTGFRFEGYTSPSGSSAEEHRAGANWVSPKYFETAGIPILAGRGFLPQDSANSQPVAIINETMARYYTGQTQAVGRHFTLSGTTYEIIGVAKDAKYTDLREPARRFVYFASMQGRRSEIRSLEIRLADATSMPETARAIRQIVKEVEPRLRVLETITLEQRVSQKVGRELLIASLAGFFGGLTLLLVIVGVYGMLAYNVARRTREIGIRIALGGPRNQIAASVLRELSAAALIGAAAGLALSLAAGRAISSMLFGLKATDTGTMLTAAAILGIGLALASYFPVYRACSVDPSKALRLE